MSDELTIDAVTEPTPKTDSQATPDPVQRTDSQPTTEVVDEGSPAQTLPEIKPATDDWEKRFKDTQAELTRKSQRLAELERGQGHQPAPPKDIYEAFARDPIGVKSYIKSQIYQKQIEAAECELTDPDRRVKALKDSIELQKVSDRLDQMQSEQNQWNGWSNSLLQESQNEIRKNIPDFDKKSGKLREYVISKGMPEYALGAITHPAFYANIFGPEAGIAITNVLTTLLNEHYDLVTTGQRLKNKGAKKPTNVEGAGSGFETSTKENANSYLNKAKNSGKIEDFARYLDAKKQNREE